MGVKEFLAKLFRRNIIQQNFITKTPEEALKELQKEYYGNQLLKENAQLKTEIVKLSKQIKEKEIQKEIKKEEEELEKEIWNKRVVDKKLEKQNSVIFQLFGAKSPKLFTKSNKSLGKFVGLYAKQQEDGTTLWYPLIKEGLKLKRINCPAINPLDFFNSVINIPSQLRAGKFDTDIDFSKEGRPVLVKDKELIEKLIEGKLGKNVKIFHLDELERREYEQDKMNMKEQMKQLYSQLRSMQEKEVEYEVALNEGELTESVLSKDRDLHASRISHMMDKQHAMAVETAKANTSVQDAVLNQVLTEKAFTALLDSYDKKVASLAGKLSKDDMDIAKEEIKKTLLEGIMIRKSAESVHRQVVMSPAPSEKDVQKAIENRGEK